MPRTTTAPVRSDPATQTSGLGAVLPGLLLCLAASAAAQAAAAVLPGVSALIIAIVAGVVVANLVPMPQAAAAGMSFSAKKLLRAGIVLLGLQLVLGDILALGAPMLLVVVTIVAVGMAGTVVLGRLLRVDRGLTLLVACGFSICGAAAVAAAAGVTDPDDEHEQRTVTAVALVVIFGTIMIALIPALAGLLDLAPGPAGLWAGGSIHEIAQVVAAGGVIGGGALTIAVVVKLARVLMLAPVMAVLSLAVRRRAATPADGDGGADAPSGARAGMPPLVPAFVLGFLAMVLLRSFVPLSPGVLAIGDLAQTTLLAAAMFSLGCGVRVRSLVHVGLRPFVLAAASSVLIAAIALLGVSLVS